ncbi:MAG: Rpn family recombination-promoting nuclease/putative transposase [Microcoleus sp. CSU_2_2]|nr:Rpn family recombination-promoting nuclease/putative transposase [Microcoleus sp. SU_5_3]NJS13190.1 Rpn family recombination-promoting nuclease/putative transposase [Microcoleus sp. CSU_2_2]
MRFINPKIDLAFKKIFGCNESKDIPINFLNAILYEAQPVIQDLEIIVPQAGVTTCGIKDTYLDIKARINGDKIALIELQVINVSSFGKRVLHNGAKTYSLQLTGEERYEKLKKVISLKIANFEMFSNQTEVISRFVFKEKEQQFDYPDTEIELVFVELPKFSKELAQLETTADKWIYFLKSTSTLETLPEILSAVPEIQKALKVASENNFTQQELKELAKQELWVHDQQSEINLAREQATKTAKLSLILRQMVRRFGTTIEPEIENSIRQLSVIQLENLGDAVLDFKNLSDLAAWLQTNTIE